MALVFVTLYRSEVLTHRRRARIASGLSRVPWLGGRLSDTVHGPAIPAKADAEPAVALDGAGEPLPDDAVIGAVESPPGAGIEARSRDRVALSGWAASGRLGTPVRQVRVLVDGTLIGAVDEFLPRPDIARRFGCDQLLRTGWQTMCYLPMLALGDHRLEAVGVAADGTSAPFWSLPVRIVE